MNENNESPFLRSATELKEYLNKKRASLPDETSKRIDEALSELVDSMERMSSEREGLKRLDENLSSVGESLPANVIPLTRKHMLGPETTLARAEDKRWILKIDCLIESRHIADIHKMALELHSHSRRYAFLEFRSLDKATKQSTGALRSLGHVTLFVPSILDLTASEQSTMLRLVTEHSLERPLVMMGSTLSYSELRGQPGVNPELLLLLARAYIKLGRPFHEYKQEGLIHYFLDSLAQNPT